MLNDVGLGFLNVSISPQGILSDRDGRSSENIDLFTLPSESRSAQLVELYFSDLAQLFPMLHRSAFLEDLNTVKEIGPTMVRRTWLGLLNMVLAIASTTQFYNDNVGNAPVLEAQKYYERAMRLCDAAVHHETSLEIGRLSLMCSIICGGQTNNTFESQCNFSSSWCNIFRQRTTLLKRAMRSPSQ